MARQSIAFGLSGVFVNETTNNEIIAVSAVYVNETSGSSAPPAETGVKVFGISSPFMTRRISVDSY